LGDAPRLNVPAWQDDRWVYDVRLQPLDERWLDDVAELVADPHVRRFTRIPEPPPEDFARSWIDKYREGQRDGTCEGFAVVDGDGRFVGLGLAPAIDRRARELELGYIVASGARWRGIATEIFRLLTDWAFHAIHAERAFLITDLENRGVAAGRRAVWLPARRRHAFDPHQGRPTGRCRALVAIADRSLICSRLLQRDIQGRAVRPARRLRRRLTSNRRPGLARLLAISTGRRDRPTASGRYSFAASVESRGAVSRVRRG